MSKFDKKMKYLPAMKPDQIDIITDIFDMKEIGENHYLGFLCPNRECGICPYGRAAFQVSAKVKQNASGFYEFIASISSIDDSGLTLFHPVEEINDAIKRLGKFLEWIKEQRFMAPDKGTVEKYCLENRASSNYW